MLTDIRSRFICHLVNLNLTYHPNSSDPLLKLLEEQERQTTYCSFKSNNKVPTQE